MFEADTRRVVCISDTHGMHEKIGPLPPGDILIHAGDFTNTGEKEQIRSFVSWMSSQPHTHKILIAGNHDTTLHKSYYLSDGKDLFHRRKPFDPDECRSLVMEAPNLTYLEDSGVEVAGLKVWGSPWQPEFCNWAFNLARGEQLREKWALIPDDVEILVTHGPPFGYGDLCSSGLRAGCEDLLHTINDRVRPRLHVAGHVHEGYGTVCGERTVFVNASSCTLSYRPTNSPIVIDVPLDKSRLAVVVDGGSKREYHDEGPDPLQEAKKRAAEEEQKRKQEAVNRILHGSATSTSSHSPVQESVGESSQGKCAIS